MLTYLNPCRGRDIVSDLEMSSRRRATTTKRRRRARASVLDEGYYRPRRRMTAEEKAELDKVLARPAVRTNRTVRRAASVAGPLGAIAGGLLGGPKGAMIGAKAGSLFRSIFGRGAYTVVSNTIMKPSSYMNGSQIPLMHNDQGTARIRHREYVQDLSTSVGFSNTTFAINPTNSQLFPWLSALAQNYEQYKILGMVVEWKSLSADALNSTNTALGSVSFATQYNALDAPFVNKQQVLNYQFATSCKPAESMLHPIECDPTTTPNQPLYVRIGSQINGDARLYDMGVINFCSVGSQAASVAGEMWISYDILLIKPRISSGLGLGLRTAMYSYRGIGGGGYIVGDDDPLGTEATALFDGIGLEFKYEDVGDDNIDCTITFPVGCEGLYLLQNTYFGDGTAAVTPQALGSVTYTNCAVRSLLYNVTPTNPGGSADVGNNATVTGCRTFSADNIISIPDPNLQASITYHADTGWDMGPGVSEISIGNIVICQLNNLLQPVAPTATPGVFRLQLEQEEDAKHEEKKEPPKVLVVQEPEDDFETADHEGAGGPPIVEKKPTVERRSARSLKPVGKPA